MTLTFDVCKAGGVLVVEAATSTVALESVFHDAGLGMPALSNAAAIFPCCDIETAVGASSLVRRMTSVLAPVTGSCESRVATNVAEGVEEDASFGVIEVVVVWCCRRENPRRNRTRPRTPQTAAKTSTAFDPDNANGK